MKIKVNRRYKGRDYTIGSLFVDGVKLCDTLEDTDRGLTNKMTRWEIQCRKLKGKTAIPTGTYFVDMTCVSPRFKTRKWAQANGGRVPRLCDVPGFAGVLLHVGNTAADTEGCILVGYNTKKGMVTNSTKAYLELFAMMDAAAERGEKITIEIC